MPGSVDLDVLIDFMFSVSGRGGTIVGDDVVSMTWGARPAVRADTGGARVCWAGCRFVEES